MTSEARTEGNGGSRRLSGRFLIGTLGVALVAAGITAAVVASRHDSPVPPAPACHAWARVPSPTRRLVLTSVFALSEQDVWLVGSGDTPHHVWTAHWNGAAWKIVPSPVLPRRNNGLEGIGGAAPDDLWATGFADHPRRANRPLALHWDGRAWSVVSTPALPGTQGSLDAVGAVSTNDVWAVGSFGHEGRYRSLIEHWDGHAWSVASIPNESERYATLSSISAASADDVWAVGYDSGAPYFTNIVLHWDGSSWRSVDVPPLRPPGSKAAGLFPLAKSVVALGPSDVWIAATAEGILINPEHPSQNQISPYFVHSNGTRWTAQRGPAPPGRNARVNGIAGNDRGVLAVGSQEISGAPFGQPVVYALHGGLWGVVSSPTMPPASRHMDDGRTNELSAVAVDRAGNAWSIGNYAASRNSELPLVERRCPAE
jgi:hypothetical protein